MVALQAEDRVATSDPEGRRRVDTKQAKGERAVASVLGCHVEVLEGCRAKPDDLLAEDVDGLCTGATHVVRTAGPQQVAFEPLSLGDHRRHGLAAGPWTVPWCAPGSFELHRVEDHPRVLLRHDEM